MIVFVNCISVRLALRVQMFFTVAKLSAIAMHIVTGLVKLGQGICAFLYTNYFFSIRLFGAYSENHTVGVITQSEQAQSERRI